MKKIFNLFIPKPFTWQTFKRRCFLIFYFTFNFRLFLLFYKKLPDNHYKKRLKENPINILKIVGYYLSEQFTLREKAEINKYHHRYMCSNYSDSFLNTLCGAGIILWQKS